jgi:thiamine-phosphate pyrophosphorylase
MMDPLPKTPGVRRFPDRMLMLVTDRSQCGGRELTDVVREAVAGGVNAVQLREKELPAGDLLALARQLRGICGPDALLIINDRVDVALLCGADGVQLGENGLPVAAVRQMLPPSMLVGASVHSVRAARQAELDGADYLLLGTIYPSPSHSEVVPAGTELLQDVTRRLGVPVVAIGGINADNAGDCWRAGARGIAVVSAIARAADPRLAAQALSPAPREERCD